MKKISKIIGMALIMLVGTFTVQSQVIDPPHPGPIYKQGKLVQDSHGTNVFVCPHSEGTVNCV